MLMLVSSFTGRRKYPVDSGAEASTGSDREHAIHDRDGTGRAGYEDG